MSARDRTSHNLKASSAVSQRNTATPSEATVSTASDPRFRSTALSSGGPHIAFQGANLKEEDAPDFNPPQERAPHKDDEIARIKAETHRLVSAAYHQAERAKVETERLLREAALRLEHAEERLLEAGQREQEAWTSGFDAGRLPSSEKIEAALPDSASEPVDASPESATEDSSIEGFETLQSAVAQLTETIQTTKAAWVAQWEKTAVRLAAVMAAKVIRRELASDPLIPVELVREALELASGEPRLIIRLHDADHPKLLPHIEKLVKSLASAAEVEIIADPEISPGGCRIDTPYGSVDQRMDAQLERTMQELLTADSEWTS
jgi:flagellar assembly protein FliH